MGVKSSENITISDSTITGNSGLSAGGFRIDTSDDIRV